QDPRVVIFAARGESARLTMTATPANAAEQRLEEVAEVFRVAAAVGAGAGKLEPLVPTRRRLEFLTRAAAGAQLVVGGALLGVAEHFVGLVDLFHPLGGVGLLAEVGVELPRQLAARALDVLGRGIGCHTERGVVILELHDRLLAAEAPACPMKTIESGCEFSRDPWAARQRGSYQAPCPLV